MTSTHMLLVLDEPPPNNRCSFGLSVRRLFPCIWSSFPPWPEKRGDRARLWGVATHSGGRVRQWVLVQSDMSAQMCWGHSRILTTPRMQGPGTFFTAGGEQCMHGTASNKAEDALALAQKFHFQGVYTPERTKCLCAQQTGLRMFIAAAFMDTWRVPTVDSRCLSPLGTLHVSIMMDWVSLGVHSADTPGQ